VPSCGCENASVMAAKKERNQRTRAAPFAALLFGETGSPWRCDIIGTLCRAVALAVVEVSRRKEPLVQAIAKTSTVRLALLLPVRSVSDCALINRASGHISPPSLRVCLFVAALTRLSAGLRRTLHPRWGTPGSTLIAQEGSGADDIIFLRTGRHLGSRARAGRMTCWSAWLVVRTYFSPTYSLFASMFKLQRGELPPKSNSMCPAESRGIPMRIRSGLINHNSFHHRPSPVPTAADEPQQPLAVFKIGSAAAAERGAIGIGAVLGGKDGRRRHLGKDVSNCRVSPTPTFNRFCVDCQPS